MCGGLFALRLPHDAGSSRSMRVGIFSRGSTSAERLQNLQPPSPRALTRDTTIHSSCAVALHSDTQRSSQTSSRGTHTHPPLSPWLSARTMYPHNSSKYIGGVSEVAKRRELAARVYTHFLRERFSTARPPPGRSGEAASSSSPSSSSPPCSTCALRKPSASRCSRERLPVTSTSASAVAAAAVWRPALMPGSPLTTLSSAGPSWRAATLRHGRSLAPSHAHLVCIARCVTWRDA